jgi:solute:Na+ symporter, SSS family
MTMGGYFTGAMTHLNLPRHGQAGIVGSAGADVYTSPKQLPAKLGPDGQPVLQPNGKPVIDWDRWMPSYLLDKLPAGVMLVIALLVFSASMSTLSSLVLVSSSAIAMDLYAGGLSRKVERRNVLNVMRILCGVFVVISLCIALRQPAQIINLMALSWGALTGAFAAPYLFGLFWRRATAAGTFAGMVAGVGGTIIVSWVLGDPGITASDPGIPIGGAVGILLPFIVVPIVSLLTKPVPKEQLDTIFATGAAAAKLEAAPVPASVE